MARTASRGEQIPSERAIELAQRLEEARLEYLSAVADLRSAKENMVDRAKVVAHRAELMGTVWGTDANLILDAYGPRGEE